MTNVARPSNAEFHRLGVFAAGGLDEAIYDALRQNVPDVWVIDCTEVKLDA